MYYIVIHNYQNLVKNEKMRGFVWLDVFAVDRTCIDETITGTHKGNILVPSTAGFNLCVLDDLDLEGNITVEANAAVFVHNGSDLRSDIKLLGQFSAINFEGTGINTLKGNIQGTHEDSYIYLDSVTVDGNVQGKGEVYVSSSNRSSGPVIILGNYIIEGNGTTEFALIGDRTSLSVRGNLLIEKQLSITLSGIQVGGNIHIKDNENTSGLDSFVIIKSSDIGGILELEKNNFDSILISDLDIENHMFLKDNDSPITVDDTTIGGNANCSKNQSDVTGSGNTVLGKATKQCKNI